ncbi:MATE family efflux transporter [Chitinimonas lacunae]|uniref:MATE family efflux transporter n=1 Tax=Chitinimonas lacunae TaxID=1963018 RepID=A0ABV8MNU7_9NEIS
MAATPAGSTYNPLLEGPVLGALLKLAIPVVFANILQSVYQLTAAFWVGRLGSHAVAAVSVCFPITFLLFALGSGLGIAGSTLVAQYVGARNTTMVNHVAGQTFLMVIGSSLLLSLGALALAPWLLQLVGVTPVVYDASLAFLRISLAGVVFTFGFAMFQALMRGVGEVRIPLYIIGVTVVLNFGLTPLLIFGWGPLPGWGVEGAALATLITQALALAAGVVVLLRGDWGIHLRGADLKPDLPFIRRAFLLGFPASVELSARALGMNIMTFLVTGFGTLAIAAYGVVTNILNFVIVPAMGLSMATSTLVGQSLGANQLDRARQIARLSAMISFVGLSVFGVLIFALAGPVVRFFIPDDPAVIASGTTFLRIVAFSFGFMGLQLALIGVFRASGNTFVTMILALVSQWVLQFPLAFVLSRQTVLSTEGLWWSFPVTNILTAVITYAWFKRGDWTRSRLARGRKLRKRINDEILIEENRVV